MFILFFGSVTILAVFQNLTTFKSYQIYKPLKTNVLRGRIHTYGGERGEK